MPLPLLPIILAAVAALGVAAVILTVIYWNDIVEWFRSRNDIKEADKNNIAFTIKENLRSGNYKVVQGIFNKETEELKDVRIMESESLDDQLMKHHEGQELVIYE